MNLQAFSCVELERYFTAGWVSRNILLEREMSSNEWTEKDWSPINFAKHGNLFRRDSSQKEHSGVIIFEYCEYLILILPRDWLCKRSKCYYSGTFCIKIIIEEQPHVEIFYMGKTTEIKERVENKLHMLSCSKQGHALMCYESRWHGSSSLSTLSTSHFVWDKVLWGNNVQSSEWVQLFLLTNNPAFEKTKNEWKLKLIGLSKIPNNISFVVDFQKPWHSFINLYGFHRY